MSDDFCMVIGLGSGTVTKLIPSLVLVFKRSVKDIFGQHTMALVLMKGIYQRPLYLLDCP